MKPNKEKILDYLTREGPASINKIATALKLEWITVSLNIAELKADNKVIEKEKYGNSRVLDVVRND